MSKGIIYHVKLREKGALHVWVVLSICICIALTAAVANSKLRTDCPFRFCEESAPGINFIRILLMQIFGKVGSIIMKLNV